ncbi:MAG: hypothetical protein KA715_12520 [Xanthomonadaceae bacterium]|nr:hypothetical protein [Xanthomonadaceae bacterium]
MFSRVLLIFTFMSGSVFAGHTDQVHYSIQLNYNKGRLFADLKQEGSITWTFTEPSPENQNDSKVSGVLIVKLPESYKTDEMISAGEGWVRIDEQTFTAVINNLEFKTGMSFWRLEPNATDWKKVFYDVNIQVSRSAMTPFGVLGMDCDQAGLRVGGLPDLKRIPYVAFHCSLTATDELIVDALISKEWTPRFGDTLRGLKPKIDGNTIHFSFPAVPRKSEKDWGEFWLSKGDFEVALKIGQGPPPKKILPYPPSRWQFGMMFNYMVYSENPDVGAVNWTGIRLDVDHKRRMIHRFLDWNFHAFLNQAFTFRVSQTTTDFPMGLLYGAYAGVGPAFKNKWQKAFWTVHFGGFYYGMLTVSSSYGFDYLAGPYVDLVIRIPHGDVNIRRGGVVTARYAILTEALSQFSLENRHLNINAEYWFNANWAVRAQWDSFYYQSLSNVNLLQWNNYGLGVVYAP